MRSEKFPPPQCGWCSVSWRETNQNLQQMENWPMCCYTKFTEASEHNRDRLCLLQLDFCLQYDGVTEEVADHGSDYCQDVLLIIHLRKQSWVFGVFVFLHVGYSTITHAITEHNSAESLQGVVWRVQQIFQNNLKLKCVLCRGSM